MFIIFGLVGIFFGLVTYWIRLRRLKSPPGPWSLPILGNLQLYTGNLIYHLQALSEKYGPIFSLRLGPAKIVVLNSYEVIREAFAEEVCSGRPVSDFVKTRSSGKCGIIFSDGPELQELRRFVLRSLRDLGFGKSALEDSIILEVTEVSEMLKAVNGKPTELRNKMNHATLNALWRIATGESFSINVPVSQGWFRDLTEALQNMTVVTFFNTKIIRFLYPPFQKKFEKDAKLINDIRGKLREVIDRHIGKSSEGDLVSLYLNAAMNAGPNSSLLGEEGLKNLEIVLLDLFVAGSETTATTLTWFFLLMALNPDIQMRVQNEIDKEVGRGRLPSTEDRNKLPYTVACINETLRYVTIAPIGISHRVLSDCELAGYRLAKDTVLISNIHAALHDSQVWEKPSEYYPQHFLEDSQMKSDAFIPFSVGRRMCLGESLARMELFLFATCLLQQFDFALPKGTSYKVELSSSIFRGPKTHSLIITPRKWE